MRGISANSAEAKLAFRMSFSVPSTVFHSFGDPVAITPNIDRLVARGATVLAVDPAKLAPHLQSHRKVRHIQESAFAFAPATSPTNQGWSPILLM